MALFDPTTPVVLDGGLGSHLEQTGHDLSGELWSARLLRDAPDAIVAAHRDYFAAGAEVAITASYQLSYSGMHAAGHSDELTTALLAESVALAARARDDERPGGVVAASIGPYGAARADGSEYRGDYELDRAGLSAWHERRFAELASSGADLLAIETIPSRDESLALLELLKGSGATAWLSFTVADGRLRTGGDLAEAFADADRVDEVVAVGINCSHPDEVDGAIRAARTVTDKPIVVYPNSGEHWNRVTRRWEGDPGFDAAQVTRWREAGASIIGGCCRVGPREIAAIAAALR
ncbi:homocysteine S-methyltransferase [Microcella putealis]|uniref:Homocysteine S-methyltransferase n=1 Tax=Microcella putealis TaxID=337005 RepID=A0A4Q7LX32_9MICO|nr:homocysteine S-methyltransferase [Microcella putealis]RZS59113.1 homocysteine S-methyltransferase [Microcella putealis]TQM24139.1 homocysteine S-methyltransferase [Microcella putealis]